MVTAETQGGRGRMNRESSVSVKSGVCRLPDVSSVGLRAAAGRLGAKAPSWGLSLVPQRKWTLCQGPRGRV